MTLIHIKTKDRVDIETLRQLVVKYIFDQKGLSLSEESTMKNSLVNWVIHNRTMREMHRVNEYHEFMIQMFDDFLTKNDAGHFDKVKEDMKRHNIDYRKRFWFPGAHTEEGFAKGREALAKAMKENPEDYL